LTSLLIIVKILKDQIERKKINKEKGKKFKLTGLTSQTKLSRQT
jgi:uncharacterized membrane protein